MATATTKKRIGQIAAGALVLAVLGGGYWLYRESQLRAIREVLWAEIKPVALKNCEIKRVGSEADGGYLMCGNLLPGVQSIYSYGIDREDNWGCDLSKAYQAPVHQYDCFTPERPKCEGGKFVFHEECIGPTAMTNPQSKIFDTLTNQIAKNGDAGKKLLVKLDVEGAEWDSLLATSDDVLDKIEQMPMELHGVNEPKFAELVKKLKKTFFLVSVHFNNYSCSTRVAPMSARAFQVLWVNKRIGVLDPNAAYRVPGSPPDAPDAKGFPDCQPAELWK